jgi:hypothetical protein
VTLSHRKGYFKQSLDDVTLSTGVDIWTPYLGCFSIILKRSLENGFNSTRSRDISSVAAFWHCECTSAIRTIEQPSQSLVLSEDTMRSDLVFGAMTYVSKRFLLTSLASKATRSFHRPNTRIQDTANEVFERFSHANPLAGATYAANPQLCPSAAQGETHSFYEDLEQSVA